MMYDSWDTEYNRQFIVTIDRFLLLNPHNNPENRNFEKIKKSLEILFYACVL